MGTKILDDIRNDVKLLITSLTGFEEAEDGFSICERFALSQIKHHKYLSINAHETRRLISEMIDKFNIHGKYSVAKKLRELVDSFLTSFDFDRHPQYDLQWSLLSFLLNLSSETAKSSLSSLNSSMTFNLTLQEETDFEEIDWAQYLKEGENTFFHNYQSDSEESKWSDIEDAGTSEYSKDVADSIEKRAPSTVAQNAVVESDKFSKCLAEENESRHWLETNVQNSWWNELDWRQCHVDGKFPSAKLCEFWRKNVIKSVKIIGTISEYQVCRELLWMLHVPSQMLLFREEKDSNFVVRDNVSIPSLTIAGFNGILRPFCDHFSMLREFEKFERCLYSSSNDGSRAPSFTYEMYNSTVQQILLELKCGLVDVEKAVMKQDKSTTLLSLSFDLNKYLQQIEILHEVHKSVISDWRLVSNWKCVYSLLSGLYFHIENSHNEDRKQICTKLYISSLTVYLNIIDVWLSEGRLEDYRDEFLVSKSPEASLGESDSPCEKFTIRKIDQARTIDPLMKILLQKIYQMGRNIELLIAFGRVSDMWNDVDNESGIRKSLSSEFHDTLFAEISKYNPQNAEDSTDFASEGIVVSLPASNDADLDYNIVQQMSMVENPFLKKAFGNFLPTDSCEKDAIDSGLEVFSKSSKTSRERKIYLKKMSEPILPIRQIIERTLLDILNVRYSESSKLVKDILTHEYKLEGQLKLMRSVYLMETSHIMNGFCFQLFYEIENNAMWYNPSFLTCVLEESLSQKWPDTSSQWSITNQFLGSCTVLQAVDNITLHYTVDWPINMLLNESTLSKYNSIFRFHLKLKWALWTLSNLRFSDLVGSRATKISDSFELFYTKRLQSLRFWLLHAVGSIHSYLCGQVLQSLGYVLENALVHADDLDSIVTIHNEYLDKVYEHCLQTEKFDGLTGTINNLLGMCLQIREKWKRGYKMLTAQELDSLEKSYVKYHNHLASALHSAIHESNADYLTSLESAFNCSLPCT